MLNPEIRSADELTAYVVGKPLSVEVPAADLQDQVVAQPAEQPTDSEI